MLNANEVTTNLLTLTTKQLDIMLKQFSVVGRSKATRKAQKVAKLIKWVGEDELQRLYDFSDRYFETRFSAQQPEDEAPSQVVVDVILSTGNFTQDAAIAMAKYVVASATKIERTAQEQAIAQWFYRIWNNYNANQQAAAA